LYKYFLDIYTITMAHYARVNSDNIVVYVTPIPNEIIADENGVEHEEWALENLYKTIPDSVGDRWIQTSYNGNFRKIYAGKGCTWNEELDAFIPPKPFDFWSLNTETANWEAPVPIPENAIEEDGPSYVWDEEIGNWKPYY
jgi:hypothetical protein